MENNNNEIRIFRGNNNLKGSGIQQAWEPWQIEEWIKCKNDPVYFMENYIKIVTLDHGLQTMKPYEFQKKMAMNILVKGNRLVASAGRQQGKVLS